MSLISKVPLFLIVFGYGVSCAAVEGIVVDRSNTFPAEIFINGRGQVLINGNIKPDKKVLRCVENLVEKEEKFNEGWDELILSECNKLKTR
jgi:hypothetical protein